MASPANALTHPMAAIFQQMLDEAARTMTSYHDDAGIIDLTTVGRHNPQRPFYWILATLNTILADNTAAGFNLIDAATHSSNADPQARYFTYLPGTGLRETNYVKFKQIIATDKRTPAPHADYLPLPTLTPAHQRCLKWLEEIGIAAESWCSSASSELGAVLALLQPKRLWIRVPTCSWHPLIWPADNHVFYATSAQAKIPQTTSPHSRDVYFIWTPKAIYQKTAEEMQADIAATKTTRQRQRKPFALRLQYQQPFALAA